MSLLNPNVLPDPILGTLNLQAGVETVDRQRLPIFTTADSFFPVEIPTTTTNQWYGDFTSGSILLTQIKPDFASLSTVLFVYKVTIYRHIYT